MSETPRSLPAKTRRKQLIKATIKCIAKNGLSGTTMADVTKLAGLSLGIVNLHFETKEKLLVETLRFITDEYRIADRNKLAVWFAFWGETKSRPTYHSICADYIDEIAQNLTQLFSILKNEQNYQSVDPELVCTCYTALSDGLWLALLLTPKSFKADDAKTIAMHYLKTQFPNNFTMT